VQDAPITTRIEVLMRWLAALFVLVSAAEGRRPVAFG
jgi:hypothetical protein